MPIKSDLLQTLDALKKLPPKIKNMHLGIVPTQKGWAIRMADDEEGRTETLKAIDPETAQRMGPALGMQPKSK